MVQSVGIVASGAVPADARPFAAADFAADFAPDFEDDFGGGCDATDFGAFDFATARFAGAEVRARATAAFFAGADFFPALRRVVISTTSFRCRRDAN
jgi:hypothetical protein